MFTPVTYKRSNKGTKLNDKGTSSKPGDSRDTGDCQRDSRQDEISNINKSPQTPDVVVVAEGTTLHKDPQTLSESIDAQDSEKRKESDDILMTGTSIIKDITPGRMFPDRPVKKRVFEENTINGAKKCVSMLECTTKNVLIQIGSNDLEEQSPGAVFTGIQEVVTSIKDTFPVKSFCLWYITSMEAKSTRRNDLQKQKE